MWTDEPSGGRAGDEGRDRQQSSEDLGRPLTTAEWMAYAGLTEADCTCPDRAQGRLDRGCPVHGVVAEDEQVRLGWARADAARRGRGK